MENLLLARVVRTAPVRIEFDIGSKEPGVDYEDGYYADTLDAAEFVTMMLNVKPHYGGAKRTRY